MGLTNKQRVFIEEYLKCWNASEAARRVGFKQPNMAGPRLILKDSIKAAIEVRIAEKAMSADEILQRLADMARGDMGDFLDIGEMSYSLDLEKAKDLGLTKLIKKVKERTIMNSNSKGEESEVHTLEVELYDAKDALRLLGQHKGLFTEKLDITTGGEKVRVNDGSIDRAITTLADAIREIIPGKGDKQTGNMDATKQTAMAGIPEQSG